MEALRVRAIGSITQGLNDVAIIHQYLESLPETGKVLSLHTTMTLLKQLRGDQPIDDFFLSILYKRLPEPIQHTLFAPYMTKDGNQIRFSVRVFESDRSLQRQALIQQIHDFLVTELRLTEDQVHLTGMMVLYNNMLQSLFRSQILTLGVVFVSILLMFWVLFRSVKLASIAIVPNILAAGLVLGMMGWMGIPLDIMTITIAAISIGIAVDDTIHYVHRFNNEFREDHDYWRAIKRSHDNIGRALFYTTLTISVGFSIMVMSNFVPTMYFGILTGFAMIVALFADLTLLPLLIARSKPQIDKS